MKLERHSKIVELIGKYEIETQEELAEKLTQAGFNAVSYTHLDVYKRQVLQFWM